LFNQKSIALIEADTQVIWRINSY